MSANGVTWQRRPFKVSPLSAEGRKGVRFSLWGLPRPRAARPQRYLGLPEVERTKHRRWKAMP